MISSRIWSLSKITLHSQKEIVGLLEFRFSHRALKMLVVKKIGKWMSDCISWTKAKNCNTLERKKACYDWAWTFSGGAKSSIVIMQGKFQISEACKLDLWSGDSLIPYWIFDPLTPNLVNLISQNLYNKFSLKRQEAYHLLHVT